MRQIELHIDPLPVDPNGIAEAQVMAGAVALTLDGVLIVGGVYYCDYFTNQAKTILARRIGILSSGDDSLITFTVVGTDAEGSALTEVVTGTNASTAESTGYFSSVTSITSSAAAAANVSAGTVDEFITRTIPIDTYATDPFTISLERFTETINVTVQQSFSRIQYTDSIEYKSCATALQGATGDATENLSDHASAFRVVCNSYTTGGELRVIANSNRS